MDEEAALKKRLEELEKRYQDGSFNEQEEQEPTEEEIPPEVEIKEPEIEEIKSKETPEITEKVKPEEIRTARKTAKKVVAEDIMNEEIDDSEYAPNLPEVELPEVELPKADNSNYSQGDLSPGIVDDRPDEKEIKAIAVIIQELRKEMGKVVMGQDEIINGLILGLLCDAHVLVEGVPGIAKTLAIRALAAVSGCSVKRIQFTVDMLPTDIIGITNYTPEKGFEVVKGPIFANFVIADEINRAPPKTQSALMEGMQEKQVTIGKENFELPLPFFVMATENPIENAGVYPLPEAQVDRFLFKLIMNYPEIEAEKRVLETNITLRKFEEFGLKAVTSPKEIMKIQHVVKRIYLDDSIKDYILAIIRKTREKDFSNAEYLSYGCSPRASIGLFIASKARALMQGRNYVLPEDVKAVIFDVLRHRLILSYKATIKKISPEDIIKEILSLVKVD